MTKDVHYILKKIVLPWLRKQLRLRRKRNNSWRSYLNLTRRFHEIAQDPYVQKARRRS